MGATLERCRPHISFRHNEDGAEFQDSFAKAPLSDAARNDLVRLHGKNPDYMAKLTVAEKKAKLARISYQDYLLNIAKMDPGALPDFLEY